MHTLQKSVKYFIDIFISIEKNYILMTSLINRRFPPNSGKHKILKTS